MGGHREFGRVWTVAGGRIEEFLAVGEVGSSIGEIWK